MAQISKGSGGATKQGSPILGGAYSYDQLKSLWVSMGGDPSAADVAAAVAMAESGGKPGATNVNTNGSIDRGLWQINSVHGALSTTNVNNNALAAISISRNGKDWTPWVTFNSGAYKQFLQGGSTPAGSGSQQQGSGDPHFNLLTVLGDLLTANFTDLAVQMAIASVTVIKDIGLGIGDWLVIPWWHWNQRAVDYYLRNELFSNDNSKWTVMPWTAAFWGIGYWLLWTDPENPGLKPAPVRNSHIAKHVRRLQSIPARRSLVKPKDVKAQTIKKPKPVESRAKITQTGTMQAIRNTPVRVEGTHVRQPQPGNEFTSEIPIRDTGEISTHGKGRVILPSGKPYSQHRAGPSSLPDRKSHTGRNPGKS